MAAPRPPAWPARPPPRASLTDVVLWTGALATVAATAASLPAASGWRLSLIRHFRLHITAGALGGLLASWALRRYDPALLFGFGAGANIVEVAKALAAAREAPAQAADTETVTLVSFNALRRNPAKRPALDWLAAAGADVIVILEVSADWRQALVRRLGRLYPYRVFGPDSGEACTAVLSRCKLRQRAALGLDDQGLVSVQVELPRAPFVLFGVHPDHAVERRSLEPQRRLFRELSARVRRTPGPVVVAGDLNTTAWSREFQRLLARAGLSAEVLRSGTFPARLGWAGLPIDHVLTGGGVRVRSLHAGPNVGSDHRPVVARLAVPRADGADP